MTLLDRLLACLKTIPELCTPNDQLDKWRAIRWAQTANTRLLELLWDDAHLKSAFFQHVGPAWIFRAEALIALLEQHAYLPHSLTRFRNRVGLALRDDSPLLHHDEVVLVWPYKDCVLEGGQSRAEQQRPERFFNELLAPDEITQLLEPKVLTKGRRYTPHGIHPLHSFTRDATYNQQRGLSLDTITDNLIIRGNNLMALASLLPQFAEKIKLIYIDPPYNTGNDTFRYNDRFKRSTWLTFMKNRLELARRLLKKDGAIFVQCDDKEQAYLKVLMDELFGEENYRATIVVKSSTPSGVNAINVKRGERLFKVKEYLLFYAKSTAFRFYPCYVKAPYNFNYRYELHQENGRYILSDLRQRFAKKEDLAQYALTHYEHIYSLEKNNKKAGARMQAALTQSKHSDQIVEFINSKGQKVLLYRGGVLTPLKSRIVKEGDKTYFGTLISDLWDDEVFQSNRYEGGVSLPGGKKPEKLLHRILLLATRPGDIVLDYYLGSGTTAAVAHKLSRQYIGIEQLDYGKDDCTVRLQNVIKGDPTGISKTVGWKGGGSFTYIALKKYNQYFAEQIEAAPDTTTLRRIWQQMKQRSALHFALELDHIDAKIDTAWAQLNLAQQKQLLIEMLDKNQLYVNLSALEDADFAVSEEEKQLTRNFYQLNGHSLP